MISDVGDISNFDGRSLDHEDIKGLESSDCIALVNWSANRKGNDLASRIFGLDRRKGRLHFFDPADLAGAGSRVKELVKRIIGRGLVDVVSLNENEARILARILSAGRLPQDYRRQELLRVSATLHDKLRVTVDVHTTIGSVSSTDQGQTWMPAFGKVRGFLTGAGDIWDAGDIVGHLLGFDAHARLRFANACAYLYVRDRKFGPPTLKQVELFLHLN
jgi:sugar/nucleoside kinase (ribokinase family)